MCLVSHFSERATTDICSKPCLRMYWYEGTNTSVRYSLPWVHHVNPVGNLSSHCKRITDSVIRTGPRSPPSSGLSSLGYFVSRTECACSHRSKRTDLRDKRSGYGTTSWVWKHRWQHCPPLMRDQVMERIQRTLSFNPQKSMQSAPLDS